jgi:hypothetical protein
LCEQNNSTNAITLKEVLFELVQYQKNVAAVSACNTGSIVTVLYHSIASPTLIFNFTDAAFAAAQCTMTNNINYLSTKGNFISNFD